MPKAFARQHTLNEVEAVKDYLGGIPMNSKTLDIKECPTCHGIGEVTLTAMRQPDEYENVPCPECVKEEGHEAING